MIHILNKQTRQKIIILEIVFIFKFFIKKVTTNWMKTKEQCICETLFDFFIGIQRKECINLNK